MFGIEKRREMKRLHKVYTQVKKLQLTKRIDGVLLPFMESSISKKMQSRHLNHHSLFFALEANKSTCCINVRNERMKSRASIVLFRGRVLSCIYGKRGIPYYQFGVSALRDIQVELAHRQTEVAATSLTEQLALSSAAILQGKQKRMMEGQNLSTFIDGCLEEIKSSGMPGGIVLKDSEMQARLIVYIYGGTVAGVYSPELGWSKKNNPEILVTKLYKQIPSLKAEAYLLDCETLEDLYHMTFSLSNVPESLIDQVGWITSESAEHALRPIEMHSQIPLLQDTFKFDPEFMHELAMRHVASWAMRHKDSTPHSHHVNPLLQSF